MFSTRARETPERALGPSAQEFDDDFAWRHRAEQDKDGSASRFQQTRQPARDRGKIVDTVQRSKVRQRTVECRTARGLLAFVKAVQLFRSGNLRPSPHECKLRSCALHHGWGRIGEKQREIPLRQPNGIFARAPAQFENAAAGREHIGQNPSDSPPLCSHALPHRETTIKVRRYGLEG